MENYLNKFYDDKVGQEVKQEGWLGWLYHKLQKFEKHRSARVIELVSNEQYNSIIDIGCNRGNLLRRLKKKVNPEKISGIDISDVAIKDIKSVFTDIPENFSVHNIDTKTPFLDNSFDLVTMVAVLEHVFDPIVVIKEVHRIMKKDGVFIVEVPNIAFIKYRINLFFGKRPRTSWGYGWDGGHLQYFTRKDLVKFLEKTDFEIVKKTGSGIFYNIRKWWGSLLLPNIIIKAKKK
ncbi:MAG: class I SAM-dependent methyltransferase [Patescibacteria group bacterium]